MDDPNPRDVIQVSDDGQKKTQKQSVSVPPIAIDENQSNISNQGRLRSVKDLKNNLNQIKTTHRTARSTPPVTRNRRVLDGADDAPTMTKNAPDVKKGVPPAIVASLTNQQIKNDEFVHIDKVWDMIKTFNPAIYDFGKKHNLGLDELVIFADCAQKYKVAPQVITEFMHHSGQDEQRSAFHRVLDRVLGNPEAEIHKQYNALEANEPQSYMSIVLDMYKLLSDEEEGGGVGRSPLADVHASVMAKQLDAKESSWRAQVILNILQLVSQIGLGVWALYGQVSPDVCHGNGSTHS